MLHFFTTKIGRLRMLGALEGISLLLLLFIAVPLKYLLHKPELTQMLGSVHGVLFLLFVVNALIVGIEQRWKFGVTCKVIVASFIPFGTFYIDHKILRNLQEKA